MALSKQDAMIMLAHVSMYANMEVKNPKKTNRIIELAEKLRQELISDEIVGEYEGMRFPDASFKFTNKETKDHFCTWLCESGEQDFFQWMEVQTPDKSYSVKYHAEDESYGRGDSRRYGPFLGEGVVMVIQEERDDL